LANYLVDKFADILTSRDILILFKNLERSAGSLRKAAIQCGLERKTIYDWKDKGGLKLSTKKKVLRSLLNVDPEETLAYMVERSSETATELLRTYLATIYEHAMRPGTGKDDFEVLLLRFEETRGRNASTILGKFEFEVGDMMVSLKQRAFELKITYDPQPPELTTLNRLTAVMPKLVTQLRSLSPSDDVHDIAQKFNLPSSFVGSVLRPLSPVQPLFRISNDTVDTDVPRAPQPPAPYEPIKMIDTAVTFPITRSETAA